MMMVLASGAQNFEQLLKDHFEWRDWSPQPPTLILVPHSTLEEILAGGVQDRRLSVNDRGEIALAGVRVLCLCMAMDKLPEFDCPVTEEAREAVEEVKPKLTAAPVKPVKPGKSKSRR